MAGLGWVRAYGRETQPSIFGVHARVHVSKPFRGTINVDIRDSEPDWTPFEPALAPDGAPSVLYIVLDDV